ncbi:integrase core domain-containing protein [Neoroseomonas soli]|uniref:integrase core domain-containing protein n=1 Tax=Neoroseomonas soli TaxID=1081025 RepID=UPI0038D0739C
MCQSARKCLNACWVLSHADARERLDAWRREYNEERPHGSLRNLTPRAFAEQVRHAREVAWLPDHRRDRTTQPPSRIPPGPLDRGWSRPQGKPDQPIWMSDDSPV